MESWDRLNSCEADELMNLQNKLFGTTEDVNFNPDDPLQAKWNEMMLRVFGMREEDR
jgi:hypothetical protein